MNVSELSGTELDYWVARAEGFKSVEVPPDCNGENSGEILAPPNFESMVAAGWTWPPKGKIGKNYFMQEYSSNWSQGGPLLEKYRVDVFIGHSDGDMWRADIIDWSDQERPRKAYSHGETPLIAACRCIVASKYGETVDENTI